MAPERRTWLLVLVLSALWTLPLWLATFPPMADFPEHVAQAAVLRGYGDPALGFAENFGLAPTRPNTAFEVIAAALAFVLPVDLAGKLVVALSLAAVGPAAAMLARRARRPWWYALFALAATWNYAFFWGFVGNLLAYPLALLSIALVDRWLDEPWTPRRLLGLAALTFSFYFTHMLFVFLVTLAAGWLAVARAEARAVRGVVLATLPAVATAVGHVVLADGFDVYEQRMNENFARVPALPPGLRLSMVPSWTFGGHADRWEWLVAALFLAACFVLASGAVPAPRGEGARAFLRRTRFATLAGWFALGYAAVPPSLVGGMICQRLAALSLMLLPAALPRIAPGRRRLGALLAGLMAAVQFAGTTRAFTRFEQEAAGLKPLLSSLQVGRRAAGLVFERESAVFTTAPVYLHFPAFYQALKGGRMAFSFSELYISMVPLRPEKRVGALSAAHLDWNPGAFRFDQYGPGFDYFLVRGGQEQVMAVFGQAREPLSARQAGRWWLVQHGGAPPP